MKWKNVQHIVKVYEAITAVADKRLELTEEGSAKCFSSSGKKFYDISYDLENRKIMCNDNSAYWSRVISYPMLALLIYLNYLELPEYLLVALKDINWNELNDKFKRKYDLVIEYVLGLVVERGFDKEKVRVDIEKLFIEVKKLDFEMLGVLKRPPT